VTNTKSPQNNMKFDVILECVGSPTFATSLKSIAVGGKIVVVGNVDMKQTADLALGKIVIVVVVCCL
jgi:NADPH:quinone reductase-like Zn-dependent oxidoreductase